MAPAASVVENILSSLILTLQGVTTSAGYNMTLEYVDRVAIGVDMPEQIPMTKFPAAFVVERETVPGGFESRGMSGPATMKRVLTVDLVCWIKLARGDISPEVQRLVSDITRIIEVDPTRGGHAMTTRLGQIGPPEFGIPETYPYHRVIVQIFCDYRHARGGS